MENLKDINGKEITGQYFGLGTDFLNVIPKAQVIKRILAKLGFIKVKYLQIIYLIF